MTEDQFSALAQLLRLRDSPSRVAAHAHFVGGLPVAEAAKQAGIDYQAAYKSVARINDGLVLIARVTAG